MSFTECRLRRNGWVFGKITRQKLNMLEENHLINEMFEIVVKVEDKITFK